MKQKILIVEDNELNRAMLSELLSGDYQTLEAENGQVALESLKKNRESISLILLDVMMPVMDGYTFLDIIKNDAELSLIPVIVMTQGDSEADEIAALAHGATDFVPKPYRPQVIKHRVASLIKLRETAAMVNQFKFDHLTGLYTKEFFYRKVREILDENPEKEYTILCCNLENFKLYNDTFGRKAGDRLLVEEARILRRRVSEDAICCRYSADRFLCLTEKESEKAGRECFLNARKKKRSELPENMSVKLGIYEIVDRSISVEQMCDRAFWVVDTIKGIYDQHMAVYDDTLRNKLLREQAITDAMEQALSEEQFTIYYQPKYSLKDDCMVGAEALVRWIHPEWGFMSPGEFIPLFEKNGFIRRLDEYVWEHACKNLRDWKEKGFSLVPVSVNVSRADIYQSDLVETFCGLIQKYQVDPSLLHLEITESAYTESPDQLIITVEELRRHGFVIEMDDFGSGYSSLNMLGQMSLDILKLDMKFIRNEMAKPLEQSLLQDVINMAHRMHLNVVAEGVETRDQKKRLQTMGCDYAQGFFFAKPMPAAEYEELLKLQGQESIFSLPRSKEYKHRILIIDEDSCFREKVKKYFHDHILEADDTEHAFSVISEYGCEGISAILLSVTLPEHGAAVFLRKMRQNPVFWKIPVIGTVSCTDDQENLLQALDMDVLFYKGFPLSELQRHVERLMDIAAFKIRENILQDKANEDYLTGLLNRRGLREAMDFLRKDELPLAVCVFDVDNLKTVNDMFGHDMGDHMLKAFANLLENETRETDIRCRYGGDEFVMILKNLKDISSAAKKGSEICRLFRVQMQEEQLPSSCSCGIALCMTNEVPSATLIEQADRALYQAKRENKGDICLWGKSERDSCGVPLDKILTNILTKS